MFYSVEQSGGLGHAVVHYFVNFLGHVGAQFWCVLCTNVEWYSVDDELRPLPVGVNVGGLDVYGIQGKSDVGVVFSPLIGTDGWVDFESAVAVS